MYKLKPIRKQINNKLLLQLLPRWQSNNSPDDLGVIRFGFELFPETLEKKYGVADWVPETLFKVLKYKKGMTKVERAWSICTSRDFSKSTWFGKILPLYFMLIGQYGIYWKNVLLPEADYIRLRAKTQEKAEEKLANVSMEFSNERVVKLFGDLRPTFKEVKKDKLKNQAKLIILRNGYIFQAQGIDQPSRGALIKGRRPKVDINDDCENKENTKTARRRAYNEKEILGEQFGGLDLHGLTILIGNYVHQECILAKTQRPKSPWKKLFFQATYFDQNGVEHSGWAKRFSLKDIKSLERFYTRNEDMGGYKIFRMEYYNEIVSDNFYQLQYFEGNLKRKGSLNYLELRDRFGGKVIKPVHVVVAVDPAISESATSSDGVCACVLFDEEGKRYLWDLSVAKFDIRDRYFDYSKKPKVLAITEEELENVRRRGLVDEAGRFIIRYNANAYVFENAGQQLGWYNDLREDILAPLGLSHLKGMPYHPKDEKVYKLENGLMNIFSAGKYFINNNMRFKQAVVSQITTFPDNKLDILDALFNAEQMKRLPGKLVNSGMGTYAVDNGQETYKPDIEESWILF